MLYSAFSGRLIGSCTLTCACMHCAQRLVGRAVASPPSHTAGPQIRNICYYRTSSVHASYIAHAGATGKCKAGSLSQRCVSNTTHAFSAAPILQAIIGLESCHHLINGRFLCMKHIHLGLLVRQQSQYAHILSQQP